MADIHSYSYPAKGSTRRTASSHIPIPVNRLKEAEMGRRNLSAPEPSRLLMMQNRYQNQLLQEKEAKLIKMYQQNQETALGRVGGNGNKRGIVRDFFKERREMEQADSGPTLDMTRHFQQKKLQSRGNEMWRDEEEQERKLHQLRRVSSEKQLSQKKLAGLSRSQPLAPIRKGQSQSMKNMHVAPPSPDGMYKTTDHFGYNRKNESSSSQFQPKPPVSGQTSGRLRAKPPRGNKPSNMKPKRKVPISYSDDEDEDEDEIPIPASKPSPVKQRNKTRPQVRPEWVHPEEIEYFDGEGDNAAPDQSSRRKLQAKPKQVKSTKSKTKPKLEWKPPVSYSDSDDELNHTPSPNFPKAAIIKRKPDHFQKRPQGNAKKESDFQKWQLEQDLERVNRLEKYQQGMERQRLPEVDYRFDHDTREQKAKQQQRKRELDDMEQQQRYMKKLEKQIAKKQNELADLDNKSEAENSHSNPNLNQGTMKRAIAQSRNLPLGNRWSLVYQIIVHHLMT